MTSGDIFWCVFYGLMPHSRLVTTTGLQHMTWTWKNSMSTTDELFLEYSVIWACRRHVANMSTTFPTKILSSAFQASLHTPTQQANHKRMQTCNWSVQWRPLALKSVHVWTKSFYSKNYEGIFTCSKHLKGSYSQGFEVTD